MITSGQPMIVGLEPVMPPSNSLPLTQLGAFGSSFMDGNHRKQLRLGKRHVPFIVPLTQPNKIIRVVVGHAQHKTISLPGARRPNIAVDPAESGKGSPFPFSAL